LTIPQHPTSERPSTDSTLTMLVGPERMPITEASASVIQGRESMFARIEADTGVKAPERHAAHFVLIGTRAAVLQVLDQLRHAVIAAPVPTAEDDR
jgi:hypothetical protein